MGNCMSAPKAGPSHPVVRQIPLGPYDRPQQAAPKRPEYLENRVDAPGRLSPGGPMHRRDDAPAQPSPVHASPEVAEPPIEAASPARMPVQPWAWKKLNELGRGAFGVVYLGITSNGKLMAVKQVEKPAAHDEATRRTLQASIKELENEIKNLQTLRHRNIVQYYGCERTDTHINIFLEWVPCGSIRKLLDDHGPLGEGIVRMYTREVLEGLRHLHKKGIMHRDIKGQNVLVDQQGNTKLADFGASTQIHTVMDSVSQNDQANCSFKGTPYFMAPEVVTGRGHGRQADIWSLGCLVFEMLTAKPPWKDQLAKNTNIYTAMAHIANQKDPPKMPDDISREARDFLERCWERDPRRRPNCDRLLAHPFLAGGRQDAPAPAPPVDAVRAQTPRVHPTVGAHPSPIQEEQSQAAERQTPRVSPWRTYSTGEAVWYQPNNGPWLAATVVEVDKGLDPPAYTVRMAAGGEHRDTEGHRLAQRARNGAWLPPAATSADKDPVSKADGPGAATEFGTSPIRRPAGTAAGNIVPTLGPSALPPAAEQQQRPGMGASRYALRQGAAAAPRGSPSMQRGETIGDSTAHHEGEWRTEPLPALRPSTAQTPAAAAAQPLAKLPVRPFTAGPAPGMPPEPEQASTPETSAAEDTQPAADPADTASPKVQAQPPRPTQRQTSKPAWAQSVTSFNPMMSYQQDLLGGGDELDDASSLPPVIPEESEPGPMEQDLKPAEKEQLLLHRQSIAHSVSKMLESASSAWADFNNQQDNPLYGVQSVGTSQAPFAAPNPVSVNPGPVPGAPLSPISENTNSRQWHSTDSLRQSRATTATADGDGTVSQLERKPSTASRPSTSGTDRSRPDRPASSRISLAEQRMGLGSGGGAGSLNASMLRPRTGDLNTFMEDMLSKERNAYREQRRLQQSTQSGKQALRSSDVPRSSQQRYVE